MSLPDVERERIPNVLKQRKALADSTLATDDDLARPPADVVEFKGDHLSCAQTEPREEKEDCVIAAADRGPPIAGAEGLLHLLG